MCPHCKKPGKIVKFGSYQRASDKKVCQRYRCKNCQRTFSETHYSIDYRLRKRYINQAVFRSLCSGVSQRRCAILFGVHRDAIARRLLRFGLCAEHNLKVYRQSRPSVTQLLFDELETFEHTKCKPLTVAIAVEDKSRKILALKVGKIPAKGPLASFSRKKYGFRPCERRACLESIFQDLKCCLASQGLVKTDQSKAYPPFIRRFLKFWNHQASPGKRGCVVGQGELKEGHWDPLFSLNHSFAMIRDGLKRLSRRTWCTTKSPKHLEFALNMYAWFHNLLLESKNRKDLRLDWLSSPSPESL